MLNDAKVSHNDVSAFESEPCRLFQLSLHTVFNSVWVFLSVFPVMLMCAELPYIGIPARAHSARPVSSTALLRQRCARLSASGITVGTLFEMASVVLLFCFFSPSG